MEPIQQTKTLGTVTLYHAESRKVILVPTPSSDPNDPLNWSKAFRYYIAAVLCAVMVMSNFLAAGPSVAIVEITIDFLGPQGPTMAAHIAKVSYFFTSASLLLGVSNLVWMPLILKFGRRPVYIFSFTLYTIAAIWCGVAKSYSSELVGRIVLGFAAGSAECLAPLTIADLFFLHERGAVMACYTAALSCGVSIGIILAGLITIKNDWRYIYYVSTALVGFVTLLVFFTMPETSYKRETEIQTDINTATKVYPKGVDSSPPSSHAESSAPDQRTKHSYGQRLKIFHGTYTRESFGKLFLRPVVLLLLPPVFWATLVMSVTIGFLVAISSNFATAFSETYGFEPYQAGLCFIAGMLGSLIGIFFGGHVSDMIANILTRRNGGVREPEMRLPAVTIGMITGPLSLILYGVGIEHKLHWMVPTLGLGLLSFSIAQATNVTLVYCVDAYRPVAGEVVVTQLAFKASFGFLLSFYTNPWINQSGYQNAFGAMAGISGGVMFMWIPFYIFGKRIRLTSLKWPVIWKGIQWDQDREVGE